MWIDERGSEVLPLGECRRLLALGAKRGVVAHLGVGRPCAAPLVLPVNYAVDHVDLLIRIGDGLLDEILAVGVAALEVDATEHGRPWSVLVRGAALEEPGGHTASAGPTPLVADPGHHAVRIRTDQVTGRRLRPPGMRPPPWIAP
jgi:hypothetical protein